MTQNSKRPERQYLPPPAQGSVSRPLRREKPKPVPPRLLPLHPLLACGFRSLKMPFGDFPLFAFIAPTLDK